MFKTQCTGCSSVVEYMLRTLRPRVSIPSTERENMEKAQHFPFTVHLSSGHCPHRAYGLCAGWCTVSPSLQWSLGLNSIIVCATCTPYVHTTELWFREVTSHHLFCSETICCPLLSCKELEWSTLSFCSECSLDACTHTLLMSQEPSHAK